MLKAVVFTLLAATAAAQAEAPHVAVANAWARATPPSASTGAVYLTLTSPIGDTLTGASTPAAAQAQVHEMSMDGAIMRMRELPGGLALPAGTAVTLQPGGLHVMLMGLKGPLKVGERVSLHLTFARSAPLDVVVPVGAMGASGPPGR